MTNEQSKIFSEVLDANWQVKELIEAGEWVAAMVAVDKLNTLKQELKDSMGETAYDDFMETGRKMFAPKQEELQD